MYKAESALLYVLIGVYALSSLIYLSYAASKKGRLRRIAFVLQLAGLILHIVIMTLRGIYSRRVPLVYSYEFASAFALGVCVLSILFQCRSSFRALGVFSMPIITLLMLYSSSQNRGMNALMPALNSGWLVYHVSTVIVAYSAFCVAFVISLVFLLRDRIKPGNFWDRHIPEKDMLDLYSYRASQLGLVFLTVTIILGALWAEQAWGNYWTWDPKETWSLITWLIYAMYLHLRMGRGLKGKVAAIFAVIGFICVLFTYIGVNTLLPGLHSYA